MLASTADPMIPTNSKSLVKTQSLRPLDQRSKQSRLYSNKNEVQPNLRKTRMCPHVTPTSHTKCSLSSEECRFAHAPEELRVSIDRFYKVAPCAFFDRGKCRNGDLCRFAHGDEELRAGSDSIVQSESVLDNRLTSPSSCAAPSPRQCLVESGGSISGITATDEDECHRRTSNATIGKQPSSGVALFLSTQNQRRISIKRQIQQNKNPPRMSLDQFNTPQDEHHMIPSEAELEQKQSRLSAQSDESTPSTAAPPPGGPLYCGSSSRSSQSAADSLSHPPTTWISVAPFPKPLEDLDSLPLFDQCRIIAFADPTLFAEAQYWSLNSAYDE